MPSPHDIADELRQLIAEAREVAAEIRAERRLLETAKKDLEQSIRLRIPREIDAAFEKEVNARIAETNDGLDKQLKQCCKTIIEIFEGVRGEVHSALTANTPLSSRIMRFDPKTGKHEVVVDFSKWSDSECC